VVQEAADHSAQAKGEGAEGVIVAVGGREHQLLVATQIKHGISVGPGSM